MPVVGSITTAPGDVAGLPSSPFLPGTPQGQRADYYLLLAPNWVFIKITSAPVTCVASQEFDSHTQEDAAFTDGSTLATNSTDKSVQRESFPGCCDQPKNTGR
jgi:hypothetical protein